MEDMMKDALLRLVTEYLGSEESWSDNPLVRIHPVLHTVELTDEEEDFQDGAEADFCSVMDLVKMSVTDPGKWEPDIEAIESLVKEYR